MDTDRVVVQQQVQRQVPPQPGIGPGPQQHLGLLLAKRTVAVFPPDLAERLRPVETRHPQGLVEQQQARLPPLEDPDGRVLVRQKLLHGLEQVANGGRAAGRGGAGPVRLARRLVLLLQLLLQVELELVPPGAASFPVVRRADPGAVVLVLQRRRCDHFNAKEEKRRPLPPPSEKEENKSVRT